MDEIKFKLGEYCDAEDLYYIRYVDIYINHLRLINLVCETENKHFGKKRSTDFCGYVGLHIADYPFLNDAFPGILPDPEGRSEFWGTVLTCTCGIDMCTSVVARVEVLGDFIMWHEVLNPWLSPMQSKSAKVSACDYSAIGPYVFKRKYYIEAWYGFKGWVMDWKHLTKFSVYRR